MWSVWRVTGRNPYCIYNDLDDEFVPWEGGEPLPPPFPDRLRRVVYTFGNFEFEHGMKLAGAKPRRQPQPGRKR